MYSYHITLALVSGDVNDLHRTATYSQATGSPGGSHRRRIRATLARPIEAMRVAAVARHSAGGWPRTGALLALAFLGAAWLSACDGADPRGAASLSCPSGQPAPKPVGRDFRLPGRIVWASDRADDNFDLYMMAPDGSGVRRLTQTPDMELAPVWSPDGTRIAFTALAGEDDSAPAWISVMNADGSAVQRLTPREVGVGAPTWSPDGTRLAFQGPDGDLYVMRSDGSQRHRLPDVRGDDSWPSWSPDGTLILLTSAPRWGAEQLWTIRPDGSSPTRLSAGHGEEGAWSPDGRSIAFASGRDGNPNARDPEDWNEEIYVMSRDGSRTTRITRIAGNDHWPPTWSPDGTHIAFTSDGCGDNSEILITDTRGSRLLNATHHPAHDFFPSWHR